MRARRCTPTLLQSREALHYSNLRLVWQVLNDLLDPSRANLKLREDPAKGFFVENLKEETLVSVDHALSVIAAGEAHRKVIFDPSPLIRHAQFRAANAGRGLYATWCLARRDPLWEVVEAVRRLWGLLEAEGGKPGTG